MFSYVSWLLSPRNGEHPLNLNKYLRQSIQLMDQVKFMGDSL